MTSELRWLFEKRRSLQKDLFRLMELLELMQRRRNIGELWEICGFMVGIGFSLWRAVFLALPKRTKQSQYESAHTLMAHIIDTHIINFPQDRETQAWMAGYYINNAILRLWSMGENSTAKKLLRSKSNVAFLKAFHPKHQIAFSKKTPQAQFELASDAFSRMIILLESVLK
jgi:hypothetical protein